MKVNLHIRPSSADASCRPWMHLSTTRKPSLSKRYERLFALGGIIWNVLKGYRQQSFSTSHYRRSTKHYPRWQDNHIERCHHPRGPQKNWARACSGHIFGQILSGWGWLHHEVCRCSVLLEMQHTETRYPLLDHHIKRTAEISIIIQ